MKSKVLLFTQGDAHCAQVAEFDLSKEDFLKQNHEINRHKSYSEALETETNNWTSKIEGIDIFKLFFSDGTVYEFGKGWIHEDDPIEEWINRIYKEKTEGHAV